MLTDLPHDVLCHVMRLSDQESRLACAATCKPLSAAARSLGVWTSVTFRDLDASALAFYQRHRCPAVRITTSCPDDVSWFFGMLAQDESLTGCMRDLHITLDTVQRVPMDMFDGLARQRGLRRVVIAVHNLASCSEVCFPAATALLELEELRIVETSDGEGPEYKNLVVWFDGAQARMPALTTLDLRVMVSDAASGLRAFPRLRRFAYEYDEEGGGETYEDACLAGCDLEEMAIQVGSETDLRHLCRELAKCRVRRLVIHLRDDCDIDWRHATSPALEDLVFSLHVAHVDVHIDFPFLAGHPRLARVALERGEGCEDPCHHAVVFHHVTVADWMDRFHGRTALDVHPAARVIVSPL